MTAQATPGTAGAARAVKGAGEVAGAAIDALVPRMTEICGRGGVLTDPAELATYECDGLTQHRSPRRRRAAEQCPAGRRHRAVCAYKVPSSPGAREPACPPARCRAVTAC